MTRRRLRTAYTSERLAEVYSRPYDHTAWPDHILRVSETVSLTRWLISSVGILSAADLACGDGAVLDGLADLIPEQARYYGDLATRLSMRGSEVARGPIEQTIEIIPPVDLAILTEAVEHLDNPDSVLKLLRGKAQHLILSTPVGMQPGMSDESNPEHYWQWERADVEEMMTAAGWLPGVYQEIDLRPGGGWYSFGLWVAR